MWLPTTLFLAINIKIGLSLGNVNIKDGPSELTDLFIENLKADPLLLDDGEITDTEITKRFIEGKIEKFTNLVSQSENAEFSRTKRSLDKERNISRYSINITSENGISTVQDDIRIFQHGSRWFVVSLQEGTKLAIFQYEDGFFKKVLTKHIKYSTNIAVLSTEDEFPLIVAGQNNEIVVLQFNPTKPKLNVIQSLPVESPQHVVMWEQDDRLYVSITDHPDSHQSMDQEDRISKIKIYIWLGRHFDLIQQIDLFNIKKSVPFGIHGSHFLAAVKYKTHYDEIKSYSEIFKFDLHSTQFKPYQRLLTNGCTDIKYFTSKLHEDSHHFLVVVNSVDKDFKNSLKSVIYKYEDQYFLPFQSIETSAVEWQPVQDMHGHAALLAVTKEGLKGFQYDGWHFFQSEVVFTNHISLKFEQITALHAYSFDGHQVLVVACNHCKNMTHFFKIEFSHFNKMKKMYSQILSWCTESLKDLESKEESDFVAESLRGDLKEQISLEENQKRELAAALRGSNEILINLEDLVDNSLQLDNVHIFNHDIKAEHVVFKNEVALKSLQTDSLNDFIIDSFIDNVLDITQGFVLNNSLEFSIIVSEEALTPKIINNLPLERYISVNDDVTLDNLVVNGSVMFEDGVKIKESLNNKTVSREKLLLKNGDQEFSGDLIASDVIIQNLTAANYHFGTVLNRKKLQIDINDIGINNLSVNIVNSTRYLSSLNQKSQPLSRIKTLKVKNLEIGGLLNKISIPILEKQALKKLGNQILEDTLIVDSLDADTLNVGGKISGRKVPDDFVMINGAEYIISQDVNFLKGFKANKLEVLHSLNNISVTNEGELDILLTDSPKIQSIPTKKSFDNLIITNPIRLRNKIKNPQMDRINPVIVDDDQYDLDGDVIVEGVSEIQRWFRVEDLKARNFKRSFRDVLEKGVKITDSQMPVHLTFTQPLDLDDTIAERVNLLNPHDWLLRTSDSPQIVNGQKIFLNDLHLKGPVNTFRLNDVDVQGLQRDALRIEGDQEIEGAFEVDTVVAENGIASNSTSFGGGSQNLGHQNETLEEFSVINGNLRVNLTKVKNLVVKGRINTINISETIRDVIRQDAHYKVFGNKEFKELYVDDLIVRGDKLDLIKLLRDVIDNEVTLQTNINLNNELNVENINFVNNLNNITQENFKNMMHLRNLNADTTDVTGDREYDQITVFGEVFISDNFINGKNLTSIEEDTVKADEDYTFDNVNFGETVFVQNSIQLEGNVENLDLNNMVEQNVETVMEIKDKSFSENVFIDGTLNVTKTLNGFDLAKFCKFSGAGGNLKTLKIEGDVIFVKGPQILNINGLRVADLMEHLWFVDKAATISGTIHLQDTTFYSDVHVQEFIDEINLKLFSQNYLSKSKDQEIPAVFSFNDVTFPNVSTPKLTTTGSINGILLDDLLKTMLLQNVTQIFEMHAYLEEVKVGDLSDDTTYSVNNLNLKTDVMLYDAVNTVTGRKIVYNLKVENVQVTHDVKIQDVNVLDWLGNALLTNGSFSVTAKKIFKDATFERGLSLRGNLNDQEFNEKSVLLVDTPQDITGEKFFVSNNKDKIKFKAFRTKGLVNGLNLESFVRSQYKKDENNILNSEIVLNNSVVVKNINVDVIYNDVNVTELLHNITKLGNLNKFKQKYQHLLDMSLAIEDSVKDQASFFKYFKEIMHMDNVYDVFGLKCKDEVFRLLTFSFENGSNTFKTFEWNGYKKEFVFSGRNIESNYVPNFMEQLSIRGEDYLYMEHPVSRYEVEDTYDKSKYTDQTHFGQLLRLINSTTFEPVAHFERSATSSLISFVPPGLNQPCLGFIDSEASGFEIVCFELESHSYKLFQTIPMENIYMASTLHTLDSLYLFLARRGLQFKDSSIVVMESFVGSPEFKVKQTIYEGADLTGLSAVVIGDVPHVAFSFGPREATVDSGRISIRRFDPALLQFVHWQHVPLTAPLGAHFVTGTSFEPLLLAPSADASSPLQTLRYDGSAGFKKSLKGASLPPKCRIRLMEGGKFVVALNDEKRTGVVLGAVVKGAIII